MMRALRYFLLLFFISLVIPLAHAAVISTGAGTSYSAGAAVTSFTLNLPASVNTGDLLLAQININTAAVTASAPSGWTQLRVDTNSGSGSDNRQYVFYRFADSSDIGGTGRTFGLPSGAVAVASMVGFRSDLGGRSVVLGTNDVDTGTNASLAGSAQTATGPGMLVRFFGYARGTTSFSSSGLTRLVDATTSGTTAGATLLTASRSIASAGATTTDSVTATNSARWIVHSLLLTESQLNKPGNCFADSFASTTTFAQNWVTTSVGTTAFTPAILSGRLRLTSNGGYISTAASLQRLFPTSNLIYVEFNYYAYNSASGADGVAVTLSDANITPQPGGFGGSLGYAQRNDSGGINGFAGGWMSVGIDEYGNYSNPTEGRIGGPGARADAIAIRGSGSGQTGYVYVAGTAAGLNIDSATTPGPGDRYRIVIDVASPTQTYVTVDRDNTARNGSAYVNLIPTFNIQAASGQAAIPANLMLSFTGSTGGSVNIHEIGNLSVCATDIDTVNQVDHFEFTYSTPGLTCEPSSVTVRACADAACSTLMPDTTTVTLTPAAGWVGGNTVQLVNGSATVQLRQTTPGTAALGVASSSPGAKPFGQYKCNGTQIAAGGSCSLPFNDAGVSFDAPNVIANKPSGAVRLRAVRNSGDSANSCIALFQNTTQNINFWSTYTIPNTGTRAVELRAGSGSGTFNAIGQTSATATAIPLVFNNAGETTFEARYNDAGLMALNATYSGSGTYAGLVISGTDPFVSTPAGFCITGQTCASPYYNCPRLTAAGKPFTLNITAQNWQMDNDPDFCTGNGNVPNYAQNALALSSKVVAPADGKDGAAGPATFNILANSNGAVMLTNATESEVGAFNFVVTPPLYNGAAMPTGTSTAAIGRFFPATFAITANVPAIINANSCGFTWRDQPFGFDIANNGSPQITVTAMNALNPSSTTSNYDFPNFWKLNDLPVFTTPALPPDSAYSDPVIAQNSLLRVNRNAASVAISGSNNGDGARSYQFLGEAFSYVKTTTPALSDQPFNPTLTMKFPAPLLTDSDGVCFGSPCSAFTLSGITTANTAIPMNLRYGRLRLDSNSGPADMPLSLAVTAEYWDGTRFITNAADSCTVVNGALATLSGDLPTRAPGKTTASSSNIALSNGASSTALIMSAPGIGFEGTADVFLNLTAGNILPWLQYDWDGDTSTLATGPTATASFGLYRGSDRVIYWRETQ